MMNQRTAHTCVVGLAWGDEGKGKIVDLLAEDFDVVVRFNGGANAGHTVCIGADKFALHLVPVGVLREGVTGVIGPGVVVDPAALLDEIEALEARGVPARKRLKLSDRAHVVLPYHKIEDRLSEAAGGGDVRIGTTARGIGPCYADKMYRSRAVRMVDLRSLDRHEERIRKIVTNKQAAFRAMYGNDEGLAFDDVWSLLQRAAEQLGPLLDDTSAWLVDQAEAGKRLFFEGANGMLLDVDHGTYPYVTSSHTGPQGVAAGAGVPPTMVQRYIGVTKAYSTRVGGGPFPTELVDATGDRIRERGHEYGTTTGRPRRCGWLDAVAIRSSVRLGGVTEIAVAHLDTLSGFERVGICTKYRLDGRELMTLPAGAEELARVEPVIEMVSGWSGELGSAQREEDLPESARQFLKRLESAVGAPVTIMSVGPERTQTLFRKR
jgi:adenylosuccinate synthase